MSTRPSFFEVYAAHHLSAALRPAVRFLLEVASVRNPRLISLSTHSDQIFTLLLLVLESSQLRRHSALLAESFYSLRRSTYPSFHPQAAEKPLRPSHILASLVFAVVIPHFRVLCDRWYEDQTGGAAAALFPNGIPLQSSPPSSPTTNSTPSPQRPQSNSVEALSSRRRAFLTALFHSPKRILSLYRAIRRYLASPAFRAYALKWYPRLCVFIETLNLSFSIAYLYGHTRYFSVPLALQRLVLRRSAPADALQLAITRVSRRRSSSVIYRFLSNASERLLTLLKSTFIASIFAFRFLQYYYAAEASAPRETGPVVPPPQPLPPAPGVDSQSSMASGRCPLCNDTRTNSTACIPSGYVFCYLCIVDHLQRTQKCPVTLAPASVTDLVRVYDDIGAT